MAEHRSPEPGGDDAKDDTDEGDRERGWQEREARAWGSGHWTSAPSSPAAGCCDSLGRTPSQARSLLSPRDNGDGHRRPTDLPGWCQDWMR